ncbi:MAG: hypothetical protein ACI8PB_005299 [Desulforhopalus sp.]|jgi:hypothetical protein
MQKNAIVTTDHKIISRKSKSLQKTKNGSKKMNKGQVGSISDRDKLMALQDALQDPTPVCEGI